MKPGPKEDRLKIEGSWEDAVKFALTKKRPKGGWPKHDDKEPGSDQKDSGIADLMRKWK